MHADRMVAELGGSVEAARGMTGNLYEGSWYYVVDERGAEVFGTPFPAVGERAVFDPVKPAAFGAGDASPTTSVSARSGTFHFGTLTR